MKLKVSEFQQKIADSFYAMQSGAFYKVQWTRDCKVRKSAGPIRVFKNVLAYVKTGLNYDNIASVQAKRDAGELPSENAGLPWGQWFDFPRVIEHKGEYYLRLYPANEFGPMKRNFFILENSKMRDIDWVEAEKYLLASEFADSEKQIDCFTVKLSNLVELERVLPLPGKLGEKYEGVTVKQMAEMIAK